MQCVYALHDDAIKWKGFPRCWPFVRGICRSLVNSPDRGRWRGALMFSLMVIVILCTRVKCVNAVRMRASWWRHQMEIFYALLAACPPATGEFPPHGPVTRSLDFSLMIIIRVKWVNAVYAPHDGVIKWNHFPRCWLFASGDHRSPVDSPCKGQLRVALIFSGSLKQNSML